ncbi:MAG: helix-turn-helix domain-containing protein [Nanoarchaeota archaeon]
MIDFACKKFDLEEIIRCSLSLSKAEFKILKLFLSNKQDYFKTQDISKKLNLELSTIQRAVKKLHSLDIIQRSQKNLSSGGYVYQYKLNSKAEVKSKIQSVINSWNEKVTSELNNW